MDDNHGEQPILYQVRLTELEDLIEKKIIEKCTSLAACPIGITKEEHAASHRFLDDVQKTAARVDNIKWGVGRAIAIGFVTFCGSALLIGIAFILKIKSGSP